MTEWKEERLSQEPPELQEIGNEMYMQRKDIKEVSHEQSDGMDAYTDWECMCRKITRAEYNMLKSIEEIDTQAAIDDYTEQLIEGGIL